jgi:sugar/nucleoside kinase (ribokinase family)
MPNEREAKALAGQDEIESAIQNLSALVPLLVIKRGSRGALIVYHGERIEQDAVPVSFVDAVGAGDSFNAGFLHGYVHGWSIERCLQIGNVAGAFSTTTVGGTAAFRDRKSIEEFFEAHAPGILSQTLNNLR